MEYLEKLVESLKKISPMEKMQIRYKEDSNNRCYIGFKYRMNGDISIILGNYAKQMDRDKPDDLLEKEILVKDIIEYAVLNVDLLQNIRVDALKDIY